MKNKRKNACGIIYVRSNGVEADVIYGGIQPEGDVYAHHNIDISEQKTICREFCAKNGIEVMGVYWDDEDTNGMDPERKGFKEATDYCWNHAGEIDVIVVTNIDRLTPSAQHFINLGTSLHDIEIDIASVNGGHSDQDRFNEGTLLPLN